MVTMEGKGLTKTTQVVTQMQSDGDITLASALGMNVDYVRTDNDLAKALNDIPANSQTAWMTGLKDNPKVNWNEVNEAFDSWECSESNLSAPAAAIIAIVVTVVSAGAASSAGAALVSATGTATTAAGTTVAAVGTAATSTLMTQGALALANNQGDIGAALKELGSSDKLRHLATAMVTAGALAGFDVVTGFNDGTFPTDNVPSVSNTQLASGNPNIYTPSPVFTPESLLRQAGRSTVQAGVDSAINGSDFTDGLTQSLRGALANNLGAVAADTIGDLGAGNVIEGVSFENGSLTKTALHAVTQGAAAELAGGEFAAGAAAGATSELIGDALGSSGLEKTTQVGVAGIAGAVAGVAVTGDAEGAYTGQTAGSSVHQNNYLTHDQQKSRQEELSGCENDNDCQIDVVKKYDAIDAEQEFERDSAKYDQITDNVIDGVSGVVEAVSSPIDTVNGWIDTIKGLALGSVAEALNEGADNQHQTLVDKDQAFMVGDSEKLGRAEGNITTEYLSTQSVPGGAGLVGKVVDKLNGKKINEANVDFDFDDLLEDVPKLSNVGHGDPTYRPPESANHPIKSYPAPEGLRVWQAVAEGQINPDTGQVDRIGGFFTRDIINSQDEVMYDFAVKPEWGPQKTHVQEFEIKPRTQLQESVIGPQLGSDGTIYPGGKNQIEPLIEPKQRREQLIPIGVAKPLPKSVKNE